MKIYLTLLLFLTITILYLNCGQTRKRNLNSTDISTPNSIDTSKFVILTFDPRDTFLFTDAKATDLTLEDIQDIENILAKCISDYNPYQQKLYDSISTIHPDYGLKVENFTIDISKYKRQYFPVINPKGEKEVWINCFCNEHTTDWKKQVVSVKDGGNCYFNVKINLTTKAYFELMVNDFI